MNNIDTLGTGKSLPCIGTVNTCALDGFGSFTSFCALDSQDLRSFWRQDGREGNINQQLYITHQIFITIMHHSIIFLMQSKILM